MSRQKEFDSDEWEERRKCLRKKSQTLTNKSEKRYMGDETKRGNGKRSSFSE